MACAYPAAALLDAAGVADGWRVLDVGTGPGTVAGLAAARGALVTAVDAEPSMLEAARRHVPAADIRHAVLPDLPFPAGSFDAAVANFVINHVGDPAAAVTELRRVVRQGGRIAVTIWPHPQPPMQRLWCDAFDSSGAQASMPRVAAAKNFARTPEGLSGLLSDTGLGEVACTTISWVHRTDPEDWWAGPASGLGSLGVLMKDQPPAMVDRIRSEYDRLTAGYRSADGILALPTTSLLASGTVQ